MTTVADVTGWLEQFAPARLAEPWDNVGLHLGRPCGRGRAGHDLPDRHADHGRRGDRRAGRADRQPSSDPVSRGEEDPRRLARDGVPLEARARGYCGCQPAHGV